MFFDKLSKTKGDRENPEPTNCIGIFGLNYKTTDADLHRAFSKFGKIEKVSPPLQNILSQKLKQQKP